MKFGQKLHETVTAMDDKGCGTFAFALPKNPEETRIVSTPFTVIGDNVVTTFIRRDNGVWIGQLNDIITPSPDRVAPPCPHAGVCGGCLWQHISYDAQLKIKRTKINQALAAAGRAERIGDVIPSPVQLGYRNRMDYVVGWRGEIGLKEYGSWNKYINLSTCLLLDTETPQILRTVAGLMKTLGIPPYDSKHRTGNLRYVVIRRGVNTHERMVILVVKDLAAITPEMQKTITNELKPFCTSLLLGENPEITDLSYGKTFETLHGPNFLTEMVNGITYRIHPNAFFQTNTVMAAELQNTVLDNLGDMNGKNILDLYCGLGFFGIACAKRGANVCGHELDADAIALAKENAETNGVSATTRWTSGPVEEFRWKSEHPDAVILDPPRSGLHPRALNAVIKNKPPVVVYVSCNYRNFIKELTTLTQSYRIEEMKALDLFPQTPHVELVTKLVLK